MVQCSSASTLTDYIEIAAEWLAAHVAFQPSSVERAGAPQHVTERIIVINTMEVAVEAGKTIRYAIGSNGRAARLAVLMLVVVISWHVLL